MLKRNPEPKVSAMPISHASWGIRILVLTGVNIENPNSSYTHAFFLSKKAEIHTSQASQGMLWWWFNKHLLANPVSGYSANRFTATLLQAGQRVAFLVASVAGRVIGVPAIGVLVVDQP